MSHHECLIHEIILNPSWISSVKLIIPAAGNASSQIVGAFPCLCAAIVSRHVVQNDQEKDPHSRPNSSWIILVSTSRDYCSAKRNLLHLLYHPVAMFRKFQCFNVDLSPHQCLAALLNGKEGFGVAKRNKPDSAIAAWQGKSWNLRRVKFEHPKNHGISSHCWFF